MDHAEGHGEQGSMEMPSLSLSVATAWIVFSFAVLFVALLATNAVAPIRF